MNRTAKPGEESSQEFTTAENVKYALGSTAIAGFGSFAIVRFGNQAASAAGDAFARVWHGVSHAAAPATHAASNIVHEAQPQLQGLSHNLGWAAIALVLGTAVRLTYVAAGVLQQQREAMPLADEPAKAVQHAEVS